MTRLKVDVKSRRKGHVHTAGTPVKLVRNLGERVWLIEVRVPDDALVGGAWYETLEVGYGDLDGK